MKRSPQERQLGHPPRPIGNTETSCPANRAWRRNKTTGGDFRGSARLAKFQHVDIDRLRRGMRGSVPGILGNVEEIAVVDQLEPRRLDLRPDQRFVRTV